MEFPSIGSQCCQDNCMQLDFLPNICSCGKSFCKEHFINHSLVCQLTDNVVSELRTIDGVFICTEDGCNERSIIQLLCSSCRKHFCVKHRHIGDCIPKTEEEYRTARQKLEAPLNQYREVKSEVDRVISKNIEEAKKNDKKRIMACKLQLMRLKNKAVGPKSVPCTDRVYFNIKLPSKTEKAVFVSKIWSLGRAIDAIADECKLQNNNNRNGELKLRLFKMDSQIVSTNMSDYMKDLIGNETIIDGDNLIIEYTKDECSNLS
ncbi:hypothetical protein WA026_017613 [Henosepilachna vigintioctopunctata]|uniref:ZFAND1-like ubiquitin-like domain-containing protein n=1 Tax=Henosepilachna vigintioctopunctata TaxID=420089 RepID=A0AAW1V3L3_9CUCU